jgi:hypothetical protein
MPAISSVSRMSARSVRPAIDGIDPQGRSNIDRNTMSYRSLPTPPASSSVPSTSQSTRRSPTRTPPKSTGTTTSPALTPTGRFPHDDRLRHADFGDPLASQRVMWYCIPGVQGSSRTSRPP